MNDDVAYYRILEFLLLSTALVGAAATDCLADEILVDGVCECRADKDCSTTPFHNYEIYACCVAIMALLVVNMLSTVHYMQEAVQGLRALRGAHLNDDQRREKLVIVFSKLHPPGL